MCLKLTVAQLVKTFPPSQRTEFHHPIHNARPVVPIFSQCSFVQSVTYCFQDFCQQKRYVFVKLDILSLH